MPSPFIIRQQMTIFDMVYILTFLLMMSQAIVLL